MTWEGQIDDVGHDLVLRLLPDALHARARQRPRLFRTLIDVLLAASILGLSAIAIGPAAGDGRSQQAVLRTR